MAYTVSNHTNKYLLNSNVFSLLGCDCLHTIISCWKAIVYTRLIPVGFVNKHLYSVYTRQKC